jgi:hypothetical protein
VCRTKVTGKIEESVRAVKSRERRRTLFSVNSKRLVQFPIIRDPYGFEVAHKAAFSFFFGLSKELFQLHCVDDQAFYSPFEHAFFISV